MVTKRKEDIEAQKKRASQNFPGVANANQLQQNLESRGKVRSDTITQVFSRPAGTPVSQNVDVTNMPAEARQKIGELHGEISKQLEAQKQADLQLQAQQAVAQQAITPEQQAAAAQIGQVQDQSQTLQQGVPSISPLAVAGRLAFGNVLEKNPITGQQNLDENGNPIRAAATPVPIVPAIALPAAISSSLTTNTASASKLTKTALGFVGASSVGGFITSNKRQAVKEANSMFKASRTNLTNIINARNAGTLSEEEAVLMYNRELRNINNAEAALSAMTSTWIGRELSGGRDELISIRTWKETNVPILNQKMTQAVLTPNPSLIIPVDNTEEIVQQ